MEITLYSMLPSHPGLTAALMLEHKGLDFRVVNFPAGSQPVAMRAAGFRGPTVPGLKVDGRRIQGSLRISRALDELQPEPPLFPADPARRQAVEEAEAWGEAVYQSLPRRIFRWAVARDGDLRTRLAEDAGIPAAGLAGKLSSPVGAYFAKIAGADDAQIRADLQELPAHLDRVDELIEGGVLGGEALNAADFQIATTTRSMLNLSPFMDEVSGRPAAEHAMRVAPDFGSEIHISVPADWLAAAPS